MTIIGGIHTQQRSFVAAQTHRYDTMKTHTVIAKTTKGHRVFLEGIGRIGQRYSVEYSNSHVIVTFHTTGKRKVVASKGGVIDLEGSLWPYTRLTGMKYCHSMGLTPS
jgi:hypothetical protein